MASDSIDLTVLEVWRHCIDISKLYNVCFLIFRWFSGTGFEAEMFRLQGTGFEATFKCPRYIESIRVRGEDPFKGCQYLGSIYRRGLETLSRGTNDIATFEWQ